MKNKVADALSRRGALLTILHSTVTAFEQLKELYELDEDFTNQWKACMSKSGSTRYKIQEGFLFYDDRLCIPRTSLRL